MVRIRKFKKGDVKKVVYFIRKSHRNVLSKDYPKKVIDVLYKNMSPKRFLEKAKSREYFVAVENNKILGIIGLQENEVKTTYVNPSCHKKGIGRKLIKHLEGVAKKRKFKKLTVRSSLHAEGFYKRFGFKKIKKVLNQLKGAKFYDISMEKKL